MLEPATAEAGLALLPIDPVAPVEPVLGTTAAVPSRAPWPIAAEVPGLPILTALTGGVLLVECALGLELAVVAAPVEPVALVPEVGEPALPATTASAGPGLGVTTASAGPGLPVATTSAAGPGLPVLVDVEGPLALPVGVLPVVPDEAVVADRLPPLEDTVLVGDV